MAPRTRSSRRCARRSTGVDARGRRRRRGRATSRSGRSGPAATPSPPTPARSSRVIRETLGDVLATRGRGGVRVQYGGSVKAGNIREFMAHPEIDGALVGGASLDPEEFALIVKYR